MTTELANLLTLPTAHDRDLAEMARSIGPAKETVSHF
jgi:hypothetical protein